ncbi:MAG: carboxypeptidase regulatory-like domain-containing protein [Acidobacteria bacterium]|nr:carboxypeptidase regulatory-like domain-containing protein [Acidobacteriota bacterium]
MQLRKNIRGAGLIISIVALLLIPTGVGGQTAATIVGDVVDASGAAAVGVSVKVVNEGTGIERKVTTNEAGQYRVTPLNPGNYTIEIEANGFKKEVRTSVVLQVGTVVEIDFSLQVGQVTETIGVTGGVPTLQTEDASVGSIVNSKALESRVPAQLHAVSHRVSHNLELGSSLSMVVALRITTLPSMESTLICR